jgi:hypothetical protein
MERVDIERIARLVVRDYRLPLRLATVSIEAASRCTIAFSDAHSGAATVRVGIWCDAKVSPHGVRESLKRGLQVAD